MNNKVPFQKNWDGNYRDLFCANCYRHERFFTGGASWSPDLCACGCEDVLVWRKMNWYQKLRARSKYYKDLKEREEKEKSCF